MKKQLITLKHRLGPLGWGALVVFCIMRSADLVNMLIKLALGRILEPIDFGAIDPVISVTVLAALPITIVNSIGSRSISRLRASGQETKRRALTVDMLKVAAVGSVLAATAVLALNPLILSRLRLDSSRYVWIIAAMFALGWWRPCVLAIMRGSRRYHLMILPYVFSPILSMVLTLIFVGVLPWGLEGALTARVVAWTLTTALVVFLLWRGLRGPCERYPAELKLMLKGALPMAVFVVSTALLLHFDRLFVRNFMTSDSGGYGAVITLGVIPMLAIGPVVFVVFPLAAEEHAAGRNLRRYISHSVLLGAIVTILCVLGFALSGRFLLGIWNEMFVPYASLLWPYALAAGLHGMILAVAYVEMARHEYGFLWFLVLPALAMCGGMYLCQDAMTLGSVIWTVVATRGIVLGGVLGCVYFRGTQS